MFEIRRILVLLNCYFVHHGACYENITFQSASLFIILCNSDSRKSPTVYTNSARTSQRTDSVLYRELPVNAFYRNNSWFVVKIIQNKQVSIQFLSLHRAFCNLRVHSPTNALFINLVKTFKFTLKYTIISLLHVSVSLCTAHNTHAALRHAATSPNLYNDVILPIVLT